MMILVRVFLLAILPLCLLAVGWHPAQPHCDHHTDSQWPETLQSIQTWHSEGYCGQGIKIGIIDVAFPERPPISDLYDTGQLSVFPENEWSALSSDRRSTELVLTLAAVAPDALVYYFRLDDIEDFSPALDWMTANGVTIIANLVANPGFLVADLSAVNRLIDEAGASGILWLNSAGNYGRSHYEVVFESQDSSREGWHYFGEESTNLLPFNVIDSARAVRVHLAWQNPQSELILVPFRDNELTRFPESDVRYDVDLDSQYAILEVTNLDDQGTLYIAVIDRNYIRAHNPEIPFEIFAVNAVISDLTVSSNHSIPAPNNNPAALTIGMLDRETHELWTSRDSVKGKPEIVVEASSLVRSSGAYGSAFSTVIVAGTAAVYWSEQPGADINLIVSRIRATSSTQLFQVPARPTPSDRALLLVPLFGFIAFAGFLYWRYWGRADIEKEFSTTPLVVEQSLTTNELHFVLKPRFNYLGYPYIARYYSTLHIEMHFKPFLLGTPSLQSPLKDMSGVTTRTLGLLEGAIAIGHERGHSAITGPQFTPHDTVSFDIHFRYMAPIKAGEPVIYWALTELQWMETPLRGAQVDIRISAPRHQIFSTVVTFGNVPSL